MQERANLDVAKQKELNKPLGSLVGMLIFSIVIAAAFLPGYLKLNQMKAQEAKLKEQIRSLRNKNAQLQMEKRRLISDINYVEKIAREKIGLVKEGEIPIKILDEPAE
jgi:cell division protein FtsB